MNDDETLERQIAEVKARYGNTPLWLKAPNGEPSNLTPEEWAFVRTPYFQKKYGDWETLARINAIKGIAPRELALGREWTKKEAEAIFIKFSGIKNSRGETTIFPKDTVGKIIRHRGFPTGAIIEHLGELYGKARFAFTETARFQESAPHKPHLNFKAYSHFVNKFAAAGKVYYIRFTVQELKPERGKIKAGSHLLHSSFISDVEIYEATGGLTIAGIIDPVVSPPATTDKRLQDFFTSVKPEMLRIALAADGEPDVANCAV